MALPSLRAILSLPPVQAGLPEVIAGEGGLDRLVRWVHVSDVRDVANLLAGEELILSTGLPLRGSDDETLTYLEELIRSGAVGLIVELGPGLPEFPPSCIERARHHDFPLIVLHQQTRFVEITEQVHRSIVAEQFEMLAFAQQVHERLTALSVDGADAQSIVAAAAELIGSPIVLEDLARRVAAYAIPIRQASRSRSVSSLLHDWERRSRDAPHLPASGRSGPESWLTTPVGIQHLWGRLVAIDSQSTQDRASMVLERCAQALELGRMVERDQAQLAIAAQTGFVSDLADARVRDRAEVEARAHALGLPRRPPFAPVVVRVAEYPAADPVAQHRRSRRLIERVRDAADSTKVPVLLGTFGSHEIAVIAALGGDGSAALDTLTSALHDQRHRQPELDAVTIAVGSIQGDISSAATGLRQAQHIAEVAAAMPQAAKRRYFRSTDIRLHGLIAALHDDPRVQAFVESELDRILIHEASYADGSMDLLRQYLLANGNKTELARSSHRSRPALYKRLQRLEQILGVQLDDPDTRLSLGVALMAYDQRGPLPG